MDAPPQPPGQKGGGIFGGKPAAPSFDPSDLQADMNALSTRLRIGEERYNDLRRQLQFNEQQSLANHKKLAGEVKLMSGEMTEIKRSLGELQNRMIMLTKELQLMAKKSDLDVLRRYLDMWEPVKFVSAEQVERLIKQMLAEQSGAPRTEEVSIE